MLKVFEKRYSLQPNLKVAKSFSEALTMVAHEINTSGFKCKVIHTENEKEFRYRNDGTSYQSGGRAVVLVDIQD